VEDRTVGDDLHPDQRLFVPRHLVVGLAERDRQLVVGIDPVAVAHEPEVELDRTAGLLGDRREQRAVFLLDLREGPPRRPAARADEAARRRKAVVEVAAVQLAEEVRLRSHPRVFGLGELGVSRLDSGDHFARGHQRVRRSRRRLQLMRRHARPRYLDRHGRRAHVRRAERVAR